LIVKWSLVMVFHTCTYHILIRLALLYHYSFSIAPLPYYSVASSAFTYTIFIHRCDVFWYYSLSFSFPLLLLLSLLRQSH
jgi:hypothetical protein